MDTIVIVMFGSLISTMAALSFLEVRRIRKVTEKEIAERKIEKSNTAAVENAGKRN